MKSKKKKIHVSDIGRYIQRIVNEPGFSEEFAYGLSNGLFFEYVPECNFISGINRNFVDIFCENMCYACDKKLFSFSDRSLMDRLSLSLRNKESVPIIIEDGPEIKFGFIEELTDCSLTVSFDQGEIVKITDHDMSLDVSVKERKIRYVTVYLIYKTSTSRSLRNTIRISIYKNIDRFLNSISKNTGYEGMMEFRRKSIPLEIRSGMQRYEYGRFLVEASDLIGTAEFDKIGRKYLEMDGIWLDSITITDEILTTERMLAEKVINEV
jgi:hypothetical protein